MLKVRAATPFITLAIAAGSLSACGGGGGGSSDAVLPSADVPSIFAEPGAACTNKTDPCTELTSSSMTPAQLVAELTDPKGLSIKVSRYGSRLVTHIQKTGNKWTQGNYDYDSTEKAAVLGQNQIVLDAKTYTNSGVVLGEVEFRGPPNERITIPANANTLGSLTQNLATASWDNVGKPDAIVTSDVDQWTTALGLLTDRTDVKEPDDHKIRYKAVVGVTGGNGAPIADGRYLNVTWATCPVDVTLDTKFGTLTTGHAICTDSGTALNFSLTELHIKGSRVTPLPDDVAQASLNGVARVGDTATPAPEVNVVIKATKIGGAIYGSNAQYLVVRGSGALGTFVLNAVRQ